MNKFTVQTQAEFDRAVEAGEEVIDVGDTGEGHVAAYKGSNVVVLKGGTVFAYNGSHVQAYEGSRVIALRGSVVYAYKGSEVYAHELSIIYVYKGSLVYAFDGSHVKARSEGSTVINV